MSQNGGLQERELYNRIYANSQDSVFIIEPTEGKIIFANPRTSEDTAYEQEELFQMRFRELFLQEEQAAIDVVLQSTQKWNSGTDPHRLLKRKSGKKIIVEINAATVDFENKKAIFASVRDITARVNSEKKILEYSKALQKINAELESRVQARTADLAEANEQLTRVNSLILLQKKELDDVMDNIQEAILTINREFKFNLEHSKHSLEIFGQKPIPKADIVEFLFVPEERPTRGAQLKEWLKMVFDQPESWDLIKDFGPRELKYLRPGVDEASNEVTELRDLALEWRRIDDESSGQTVTNKIMLVGTDVTEKKRLEAEIKRKEAEHREELELISQLIYLPSEVVGQFISDFDRNLKTGTEVLSLGPERLDPDALNKISRVLHTIKGSSRQFKLESVQKKAHELESKIVDWKPSPKAFEELKAGYEDLEEALRKTVSIYEKVVQGGGKSSGNKDLGSRSIPIPLHRIEALLEKGFSGEGLIPAPVVRRAMAWLIQMPIKGLFDRIENLAQSLSFELGIQVQVDRRGDATRIDYRASTVLYDALLHVIRNSLDHGGEPPEVRTSKGKLPSLRLSLRAFDGPDQSVNLEVEDDGKGIDPEAVIRKVLEKNLATTDEIKKQADDEILNYVFLPGFSTRDATTDLSGRGVGMDVLKDTVERTLGGSVTLSSKKDKGTLVHIEFPRDRVADRTLSASCLVSSPEKRSEWSKLFGLRLDEVESESKAAPGEILLTDPECLMKLRKRKDFPELSSHVVCCGDLEPEQIVDQMLDEAEGSHFVSLRNRGLAAYVRTTANKLRGKITWGIEPYLWPSTEVKSYFLQNYKEKNTVIDELLKFGAGLKGFSGLTEVLGTIADEMIMNAMFDAPRTPDGKSKYNHLPRTENLVLQKSEGVSFKFGADPNVIAVSIEDPFGALSRDIITQHLKKGYRKGPDQIEKKKGGAGLGLFMIYDNSHCFVVNVLPGKKTEVISLIYRGKSFREYQHAGKSFSFFLDRR